MKLGHGAVEEDERTTLEALHAPSVAGARRKWSWSGGRFLGSRDAAEREEEKKRKKKERRNWAGSRGLGLFIGSISKSNGSD